MIEIKVEYDELSDGSHVYSVSLRYDGDYVELPMLDEISAHKFKLGVEELLRRYAL